MTFLISILDKSIEDNNLQSLNISSIVSILLKLRLLIFTEDKYWHDSNILTIDSIRALFFSFILISVISVPKNIFSQFKVSELFKSYTNLIVSSLSVILIDLSLKSSYNTFSSPVLFIIIIWEGLSEKSLFKIFCVPMSLTFSSNSNIACSSFLFSFFVLLLFFVLDEE